MQTRGARAVRGSVTALAATATAAASHTLAGAAAPAPPVLALAAAFAAVVCVMLSGRGLSQARLTSAVLLSQIGYHALFLITGTGGEVSVVGTTGEHTHFHDGTRVELVAGSAGHADHAPLMLVAHGVAAVLTIAALLYGERLFWTLGTQLERVVVRVVTRSSALPSPRRPGVALVGVLGPLEPRALDTALSVLRHRGPPKSALRAV
ncbi:hypothetical protein [Rathayibacter tanaceti]|uniref:Integral membrane protein n=2 Tax=Rathayibacter tanaceti TaxID=1671680 RepID=A0A162GH19_9MICO|nr:hypothetical protein [Rathayibacter tanaceti]KZX20999.1 hypothetical protein ACH61_01878 [Rathayibacter tanaceti]QHC56400.1 hypothetical protein GSU10_12655 [Rathayibacter tanaceti]TCO34929.1 hypothetical protein EV639_11083 [Rathayibacter tanaceti]